VSTGSELTDVGSPLAPGRIYDTNSLALTAAAQEAGAIAYRVGIVPDDPRRLAATLEDQLVRADVLVTSGGVSVGAYDVVKQVLSQLGTVRFDKVAMQPGMPQGFGTIGRTRPRSSACRATRSARWSASRRSCAGAAQDARRPAGRAAAGPCGHVGGAELAGRKRSFVRVQLEVRKGPTSSPR
jgi:molybdenum cofactor synthesis domain-containing protein